MVVLVEGDLLALRKTAALRGNVGGIRESVTTSFGGVPFLNGPSHVVVRRFELYRNPVTSCNAYTISAAPPGRFR